MLFDMFIVIVIFHIYQIVPADKLVLHSQLFQFMFIHVMNGFGLFKWEKVLSTKPIIQTSL